MNNKALLALVPALFLVFSCGKKDQGPTDVSQESIASSQEGPSSSIDVKPGEYDPASYYGGYYSDFSWKDGEDLKTKLYGIMRKDYHPLVYTSSSGQNWDTNRAADQALDDFESVDVLYSASNMLKTETNYNGVGWQKEHAFPACLMTGSLTAAAVKQTGRATDFHNLFASHYSGNTSRSSKNYGNADKSAESYVDLTGGTGKDGYRYDELNFEPGDHDKGRVARAIFYMATMYMNDEMDEANNKLMKGLSIQEDYVTYSKDEPYDAFAIGNLSHLLAWNSAAVDRAEYQHNESVFTTPYKDVVQGNRNVYVDYPGLVDYVYGAKKDMPGMLSQIKPSCIDLKIAEDGIANYAIETTPRVYNVGDDFSYGQATLVAVKNDFTTEPAEIVFPTEVVHTFTDADAAAKKKTLSIPTELNTISYDVTVKSASIDGCAWHYDVAKDDVTANLGGATTFTEAKVTFNKVNFTINAANAVKLTNNAKNGLQFGTSTAAAGTLSISSDSEFGIDGKTSINKVFIQGNTASGCTYRIQVKVGDEVVGTCTMDNNTGEAKIYGIEFPEAEGRITISFLDVTKAVYIQRIGINVVE